MDSNPFQSPQEMEPVRRRKATDRLYRSMRGRALAASIFLSLQAVFCAVSLVSYMSQVSLLGRAMSGVQVTQAEATANDTRIVMLAGADSLLSLICAVTFIAWMHGSYRNLPALGARSLEYSPGWTIGAWFIPFLNLVRPYQIIKEIWQASDPKRAIRWRASRVPPQVWMWWLLFLTYRIGAGIAGGSAKAVGTQLSELYTLSMILVAVQACELVCAVLAVLVVRSITDRQEHSYEELRDEPAELETG